MEEVGLHVGAIGRDGLGGDGADLCGIKGRAVLGVDLCPCGVGGVEVGLDVGNGHGGVLYRGTSGPVGVTVAPVVEEETAGFGGDFVGHLPEELAIDEELDLVGGPVEAILVVLLVGTEGQRGDLEGGGVGGIQSFGRRGGLKNQIDSTLGVVELLVEELHVDLLGVVEEPEEGAAGAVDGGQLHADAEGAIAGVITNVGEFGAADVAVGGV